MSPYGLSLYRRTLVRTADRRSAVLYLHDAAIRACRLAAEAIEEGRIGEKARQLDRALTAVTEMSGALDLDTGGALSARLLGLYAWLMRTIVSANGANSASDARACAAVLRILREGWEQIVHTPRSRCEEAGTPLGVRA